MSERIMCTCGAVLVEEVTAKGVRPVGSDDVIPFRRTTDHVICTACFTSFGVRSLIERASGTEAIDHLEAMARDIESDPAS